MKRKLLALLLCGALLLTCSPAYAEGAGDTGTGPAQPTACTKTTGCTLDEGHEGDCVVNNTDTTGTEGNGTGNTDPNTAAPNTADPDGAEPDTADPDGTDPDTADPDGTDPDTTDPDTTEPDGATLSETAQDLQAQIDALPDAAALESMTEEEQGAVFAKLDALYTAIAALTPEEAAQLDTARLDAAAEWFTSQIATYEGTNVAQIDDRQYETLAAAIEVATEGDTVILQQSVEVREQIPITAAITLNLNGNTITNLVEGERLFSVTAPSFTVNGTAEGSAMTIPETNKASYGFIKVAEKSIVTLNGGTYSGNTNDGAFVKIFHKDTLDASGSTVILDNAVMTSNNRFFDTGTLTTDTDTPTLKVTGGTYTTEGKAFGMDVLYASPVSFTDVTVTAGTGPCIEVCGPAATFTNCNFTVTGENLNGFGTTAVATSYSGTAEINGGTYSASKGYGVYVYNSGGKITIKDGTVSGGKAAVRADANVQTSSGSTQQSTVIVEGGRTEGKWQTNDAEKAPLIASGGTHTEDVTDYLAEGASVEQDETGNYVVGTDENAVAEINGKKYLTLTSALKAAAAEGNTTVKLLKNVKLTASVTISGQNVTLNLNGNTISGAIDTRNTGLLQVKQGASLTITDTNINPGSIANTGTAYTIYQEKGSTLVLDDGITVKYEGSNNSNAAVYVQTNSTMPPTLTVKDANLLVSKGYSIRLAGLSKSIVKIEGGTFMAGEGKSSTTSPISGISSANTAMTISGGTFYNWSNSNNTKYLEEGCGFTLNSGDNFSMTVGGSAPGTYLASATDGGKTCYLTGGDLYTLLQYADLLDTDVEVTVTGENVPVTFPAGSGYGVENETDIPTLTLTVEEEEASLTGNIPLCVADVHTTGNVSGLLFQSADDATYAVTNPADGAWQGRLNPGEVAIEVTHANGTVNRYTSSDAIAAFNDARKSPGSTLKLLQDVSHKGFATLHGNMTLDLNGHTYTNTPRLETADVFTVPSGATLKIVDTSGNGGTLKTQYTKNSLVTTASDSVNASIYIGENVTLSGGTVLLVGKSPTLDVYGTIDGGSSCAVQNNGSATKESAINLHDGAVVKSNGHAIYHPGTGTLNVRGGAKVTGGNVGIEMRKGTLNVYKGATITGGSGEPSSSANPSGSTTSNAGIAVAQHGGSTDPVAVNVYGGKISGGAAVYESNPQGNETASTTLNLTGGAYKGEVSSATQTGFITGGQFSTDVKEYIKNGYDQLVLAENLSYQVGLYSDNSAANTMGTNVYKVTYTLGSGEVVDVYYAGLEQAQAAADEFNNQTDSENAKAEVTETPIRPTTSGGSGGTTVSRPVILSPTQPQTALTAENSMVTLRVQASRATGYQWYVNRGDGRGWVAIPGANGASLTIWPSLADNGNQYYCLASGGGGSTASPVFTLSVLSSMRPPKTGGAPGSLPLALLLLLLGAAGYVCSRRLCRR